MCTIQDNVKCPAYRQTYQCSKKLLASVMSCEKIGQINTFTFYAPRNGKKKKSYKAYTYTHSDGKTKNI